MSNITYAFQEIPDENLQDRALRACGTIVSCGTRVWDDRLMAGPNNIAATNAAASITPEEIDDIENPHVKAIIEAMHHSRDQKTELEKIARNAIALKKAGHLPDTSITVTVTTTSPERSSLVHELVEYFGAQKPSTEKKLSL